VNQCASLGLCTGVISYEWCSCPCADVRAYGTSRLQLHSCLTSAFDGLSGQVQTSTVLILVTILLLPAAYENAWV